MCPHQDGPILFKHDPVVSYIIGKPDHDIPDTTDIWWSCNRGGTKWICCSQDGANRFTDNRRVAWLQGKR
jgi:hypothetical protein